MSLTFGASPYGFATAAGIAATPAAGCGGCGGASAVGAYGIDGVGYNWNPFGPSPYGPFGASAGVYGAGCGVSACGAAVSACGAGKGHLGPSYSAVAFAPQAAIALPTADAFTAAVSASAPATFAVATNSVASGCGARY